MSDEATYFESLPPVESVRGRVIRTRWLRHLITFLLVVGPGLIVMEADNGRGNWSYRARFDRWILAMGTNYDLPLPSRP
jgi:hypothetical protein